MKMLDGKVALVTGAGRGIGRAMAIAMAAEGAKVIVNDYGVSGAGHDASSFPADEAVAEIEGAGGQAIANAGSVAEYADVEKMIQEGLDAWGRLDVVVNNAGILRDKILHKMTEEDWDAVIAVHLKGTFNTTRVAASVFRSQGGGSVVNFTSSSGLLGNLGQTNYGAAKLGIVGFTRNAALDMARYNVRCNAIAPFAWTRMTASIPGAEDPTNQRVRNLKKMAPEQIAPLAVFLASDAAKDVNGQVFGVRGHEIVLYSLPAPVRSLHRSGGWTPQQVADTLPGTLATSFTPLTTSGEVFCYEPLF
jgi:NAD(P)-dependent dehydrogenase (short-subunit alcohol dehydrogenase family)